MAKWWSQKNTEQNHAKTDFQNFALCVDGIVKMTMGVDKNLAEIYDLKPEIIRCKENSYPGMTIEEARL